MWTVSRSNRPTSDSCLMPVREPLTAEDLRDLDLLRDEIGSVPVVLDACFRQVGGAWFAGDYAVLSECYSAGSQYSAVPILPDPLVLPAAQHLRESWSDHQDAVEADRRHAQRRLLTRPPAWGPAQHARPHPATGPGRHERNEAPVGQGVLAESP